MFIPIFGYILRSHEILVFWLAYIITRPLGASFADWFGKPIGVTGLGYGDRSVSLVLLALLLLATWYMAWNTAERKRETSSER